MSVTDDLLVAFELHDPNRIHVALNDGASPTTPINGERPLDWLIAMYTRSARLAACVEAMIRRGATVGNAVVEAILLGNEQALLRLVQANPACIHNPLSLRCAYTSLRDVTPLHLTAEFNSTACAKVLLDVGARVDAAAGVDADGVGGHTPLFHTVNSNHNFCRPMMDVLLDAGADVDTRVPRLLWGENCEWETIIFDVTPLSYAQCGLYRQFHRSERDIYDNIDRLHQRRFNTLPPRRNVPNRYVNA
jgi:hypothetical protein